MSNPRPRIYVHIGLPKTGTTYLQSIFARSESALARQGLVLLPRKGTTAFQVMLDVRGELKPELDSPEMFGALDRLSADAKALAVPENERTLLTQELLSLLTTQQVGDLVAALDPWEAHVVVTVRDLATLLPSLWQQRVKARGVTSYDGFLDRVVSEDASVRGHDLLSVLELWRPHVPSERTHVVTVPKAGAPAIELLDRFCRVLGVDLQSLDTTRIEPNKSIGLVQAELLRRVNVALGDQLPHVRAGYRGPGKRFLAETILIQQTGRPLRLPERVRPWVEERSRLLVEELRSRSYAVVGDLDDLVPEPGAFADESEVSADELVDAAAEALAAILVSRAEDRDRLRDRVRRLRRRIDELEGSEPPLSRRLRALRDKASSLLRNPNPH